MIVNVPLSYIQPNPWQTRQGDPPPDYIKELALDIAQNGLLQTPLGRLQNDAAHIHPFSNLAVNYDDATYITRLLDQTEAYVQLAFGHNRLAAYRWLADVKDHSNLNGDYTVMPVDLRQLTDEQMADFAWSENEKRRDHTPIERALAIQKRIADFGWSQQQVAEHLGVSRPVISNALRLLKLPENITTALGDGRISERVAMSIAGYFDLPETIKRAAENSWYTPSDLVREALEGKLTSDGVREKIQDYCRWFGIDLAKAPFALDDPFMIPSVVNPFCRDCEMRHKDRNLCLDKDCYKLKLDNFRQAVLQRAANEVGIPPLDNQDAKDYEYTSFRHIYNIPPGALEKIIAGKCPNLRLRHYPGVAQIPGHPDAEIICSKREQFCHCLAGLRAVTPKTEYYLDHDEGHYKPLVSEPVVQLGADQPSAEDLHAAAKAARQAGRQLQQEKQAVLQDAAERIAVGLTHGNLKTWKWLAQKIHYGLEKTVESMDNTFDVRAAIAAYTVSNYSYPTFTLVKVIKILNEVLERCGLELLDIPASEAHAPEHDAPTGKTLAEVFEDQEGESATQI